LAQLFVLHGGLPLELFWWNETQQSKCHLTLPILSAKPGSQIKLSILQEVLDVATLRVAPAGTEPRLECFVHRGRGYFWVVWTSGQAADPLPSGFRQICYAPPAAQRFDKEYAGVHAPP
jgi:hypothetical protein